MAWFHEQFCVEDSLLGLKTQARPEKDALISNYSLECDRMQALR